MKIILLSCFLLFCAYMSSAQYRQQPSNSFKDKIYFGGGGGFSGGTQYLTVSVTPLMGYKITDRFSTGVQLVYQYTRIVQTNINAFGGGPFARFNLTQQLFTYTQYEYLTYSFKNAQSPESDRLNFDSWFVGLGYSMPLNDRLAFNITALYNLLYRDRTNTPYQSPILFRVGLVAGLF